MKWVLVVALSVGLNTLYANTIGASSSGDWNNSGTWTPSSIPGSADDVYIGSNAPAGAAATATVTLTQNQAASTLNLGDGSGTDGTLDLGSNTLTVGNALNLGPGGGVANVTGSGSFTASSLNIYSGNSLTFTTGDAVGSLTLNDAQATTAAVGNVTASVQLTGATTTTGPSTLNLGAGMSLTGSLDVRDNSTVNMNGNGISANNIYLGWYDGQPVTLSRGGMGGTLTATSLYVGNQTFNLLSMDTVTNFYVTNGSSMLMNNVTSLNLDGAAIVSTTSMGTATGNVLVEGTSSTTGASTLNLGAAMTLTGSFDVRDNSTVNLNNHALSANTIYLGWYDSQPTTLNRGGAGGTLTATNLYVGNQTFNLPSTDSVTNFYLGNATSTLNSSVASLTLENGSTATTTAAGNVTGSVLVQGTPASTLNLGAAMTLTGSFDLRDNSIVNLNGNALSANTIYLGWYDSQPTTLNRGGAGGTLTATNLYVGNQTFNLPSTDSVTNFYLGNATSTLNSSVASLTLENGSTATTTAAGNVTGSVLVQGTPASTLNLGAAMTLTGSFDLRDNSIVNLNGNALSANTIYLGWYDSQPTTLNRGGAGGTLTATNLYIGNQTFNLLSTDTATNYSLGNATSTLYSSVSNLTLENGSTATTTTGGNVMGSVLVQGTPASTLNLGAAMTLTGSFDLRDNSIVNLNGNALSANTIYLGWYDGQPVTVNRGGAGGTLTSTNLYVGNDTFTLAAADTTANVTLQNADVTTSATSNVTNDVTVAGSSETTGPSTFTLGANLSVSGSVDVRDGSTLDMNGYAMSVDTVYDGYFNTESADIINDGGLTANNLYVSNGSSITLIPNDTLSTLLKIQDGSTVTVDQGTGELTGLTLNGDVASALSILDTSVLDLDFSSESSANWIFRWEDPTVGNWESTLSGLITGGQIAILAPNGYSLLDQGGYTYIEGNTSGVSVAPEPSSIGLMGFGMLGLAAIGIRRRRSRPAQR